MAENEDLIKEFLTESRENLDGFDQDLLSLEKDPTSEKILSSIFRSIHTIKGTCGFFGFTKLEAMTHAGESLLGRLREGQLRLTPGITNALLALEDAVRRVLASIDTAGVEGTEDFAPLIETLGRLLTAEPEAPVAAAAVESTDGESRAAADTTIRVGVELLDKLMTLVGELVLARNQIVQMTAGREDADVQASSQRLSLITTELQEQVMRTRLQPIGNVWNRFPRLVRDLAFACGKQVRVQMEGTETELDKSIIEAIKDPLTHLVRNAVDHGIEAAETRQGRGKPAEGLLRLRAFHEGGLVNIEMTDDGGGIDADKVKAKAQQRELLTPEQAARMSEREALELIFLPGFSTAEKITNVSGRGVGMDVVKTNIEKIGGTVDVFTKAGEGTSFKIKIPLTLAIIPALMVMSGGERYAIPQVGLLELVRLEGEAARRGIERIQDAAVYRLRGKLLPLIFLNRELARGDAAIRPEAADLVNIVVLKAGDRPFGLVVDQINDTKEIVVKPLSQQLKALAVFAGATIMGDGRVALILDILGLAQKAHITAEVAQRILIEKQAQEAAAAAVVPKEPLLVFRSQDDGRMAVRLSHVARLEEFPRTALERAGHEDVVQYRGKILPLVDISAVLPERRREMRHPDVERNQDVIQVVVFSSGERSVGLVVEKILDIIEESLTVTRASSRDGVAFSVVIRDRVTELLDVDKLLQMAYPGAR